jgi:signal transduction histidine kinase/DNA-binding response OmpR family regulator
MNEARSGHVADPLATSRSGHESARIEALRGSGLLDTAPDVAFDDLAGLAAQLCDAPFAMVGLVDAERTWFKAQVGSAIAEMPRSISLCALAIDGPITVEDTLADARCAEHPLVTGPPHARFFAGVPLCTADGHAVGALVLARAAARQIDLHRHARAVEALLSERTALLRVAHLVGGVAEVIECLRRICSELTRLTGADTASAYMLDASGALLQPIAAYHVPKWALEGLAQTPIPVATEGFAEAAFHQRQVVWSDDVGHDPRFPEALVKRFPHRSGIVVPMLMDDVVAGGFYLTWWERARTVTDSEAALLHAVGLHTGLFLRSARLHADLETRNQRMRTLIELSQVVSSTLGFESILRAIAGAAVQLMDATHVAVWTVDERRRRVALAAVVGTPSANFPVTELGYQEGGVGWVAEHRQILNLDDIHAEGSPILNPEWWRSRGLKTFLGIPVILEGRLLAVLSIRGRRPFLREPGDRDLVNLFVSQTAVALRNASLHAEALAAREAAEAATRTKSDFLAMMSHELRTPLTGVVGAAQLLRAAALRPEQHELVETLQQSAEALRSVIGDVLDLAKIEAGKLELDAVDFEPRALVEAAVDAFAYTADSKGIDLGAVAVPVTEAIVGDRYRLRQVLGNLVGNAVACTDHGEVVVRARTRDRDGRVELRVEVADSGVGIAPDERHRLFEPYAQGEAGPARRQESTGLGLTICKRLVEAMGGQIAVDSAPGRGSTFWFSVPLMPSITARGALGTRALPPARVLLVESGRATREGIETYLASWGLSCRSADDSGQALATLRDAAAQGAPFDVVVVGRRMAGLTPEDLVGAIRTTPALAGISLVRLRPLGAMAEVNGPPSEMTLRTPVRERALRDCLARALAPPHAAVDAAGHAEAFAPVQAPLHLRVLVVDDNRTSQTVATLMMRALGCDADVVSDGPTAIAASGSGVYDAILMDCNMPGMDGLAATREIRRQHAGRRRTPIIAMTASATRSDRDRCLEAGMDDHVSKPVTIETLRAALVRTASALPTPVAATLETAGALGPVGPSPDARGSHASESAPLTIAGMQPRVAHLFLGEAPRQLQAVRDAMARRDFAAMVWAAHRLKGAVVNFNTASARDATNHLEAMSENRDDTADAGGDALWADREELFTRLTIALTALLGELGRSA